ncbi:related to Inulinase [Zygosaccharomyces bailii]|nr:related to Inulinase [Zygosaccharomyces bailii]
MSLLTANRPLAHLTPPSGWMSDPNGLWYDAKEGLWHCYYQYNPLNAVWDIPIYWGHAVSSCGMKWEHMGIAIKPRTDRAGVFSGSAVVDYNNSSGFFSDAVDPRQRVVALWTRNTNGNQSQMVSYSLDGGYTFEEYANNPVLDIGASNFRDPKVIWHEETRRWIMVVAMSQKFEILIYSSTNLTDWKYESSFAHQGCKGYQYECPALARIPLLNAEGEEIKSPPESNWVMFVSISPGAPQGGSATQYFIGDFNGTTFTPTTPQARFMDWGRDFYAFQPSFNSPNGKDVLGLAWACNWQYALQVPTDNWKSSLTLMRQFHLQKHNTTQEYSELALYSSPVWNTDKLERGTMHHWDGIEVESNSVSIFNMTSGAKGLLEFSMEWSVNTAEVSKADFADLSLYFKGAMSEVEYLRLGFEANAGSFFIERDHSRINFVHENPFFTSKVAVDLSPYSISNGVATYKVRGIIDRNVIELFFNDGAMAATTTFFVSNENYIGWLEVRSSVNKVYKITDISAQQLNTITD